MIAAVESTVAAAVGVAAGFGLFFAAARPGWRPIPFTGAPFFPGDLSLSLPDILRRRPRRASGRGHGGPAGAAAGEHLPARRHPPGHPSRRQGLAGDAAAGRPGRARVLRRAGRPPTVPGQIQAFLPGFLLIMVGLVIAGPWLTMAGARLMARRTSRPGALIAARRLADDPRAGFRAVSGLVLALFITTVAVA